jgi:transposase InsO family protein
MTEEIITLSYTELDRVSVMQSIIDRRLTQAQAALQLKLSIRQVKRLTRTYRRCGATGLASKRRGRCLGNAIGACVRQQALSIIKARYIDFGPTFAHEKLTEQHDCHFSVETLRQWMIKEGLWLGKQRKGAAIHQSRPRRARLGELVQIDGSPHDWFEGRAPRCTLIVFIDDATSRLLTLHFSPTETTQAYMETLDQQLDKYGRPSAMYSDKHSIFRVNYPDKEGELTQFTRALKTLDIEPIHANTPQAKGRVERANKTLQDRLVKEMRLQGINSIEQANAFLPQFIDDYNRRFAVTPLNPDDAHRAVLHSEEELKLILSRHHQRKLSKNLTISFRNTEYQLQGYGKGYRLRGATVTVCEDSNGQITLLHKGKTLAYRIFQQGESIVMIADDKTVLNHVEQALHRQQKSTWKPAPDHPWRRPLTRSSTNTAP